MTVTTRHPATIDFAPTLPGYPFGDLVGGDTAMDTSDGDTSYAGVESTNDSVTLALTGHTFTWEIAGPISPDAVVTIEADWFTEDDGAFLVSFVHPELGNRSVGTFAVGGDDISHAYGDPQTITVSSVWVEDGAAFLPGVQWEIASLAAPIFTYRHTRVTRLTMFIDQLALEPHQIFQRKDNLGAGPSTVFDPSTRQSSSLVFGTY